MLINFVRIYMLQYYLRFLCADIEPKIDDFQCVLNFSEKELKNFI